MSETTDRTPTTEEIRRWCMDDGGLAEYHDPINGHLQAKQTAAAFDRWLTAHDAEIRAAALEDAAVIAEEEHESHKGSDRVELRARDYSWPSVSRHIGYQLIRRTSIGDVIRAAGHDPHDPHTQMPKLSELAQQMIDMPKWVFRADGETGATK